MSEAVPSRRVGIVEMPVELLGFLFDHVVEVKGARMSFDLTGAPAIDLFIEGPQLPETPIGCRAPRLTVLISEASVGLSPKRSYSFSPDERIAP